MMHLSHTENVDDVLRDREMAGVILDEYDIPNSHWGGTISVYSGNDKKSQSHKVFVVYPKDGDEDPLVFTHDGGDIMDYWYLNDDDTLSPLNEEEATTFQQLLERY